MAEILTPAIVALWLVLVWSPVAPARLLAAVKARRDRPDRSATARRRLP